MFLETIVMNLMEILYGLSLIIIGIIGAIALWKKQKKILLLLVICLLFQVYYGLNEKKSDKQYQKEILKMGIGISKNLDEIKEKMSDKLLTDKDWITIYYNTVEKIPVYFTPKEWKDSERLLYEHLLEEINGQFSMRGTEGSRISTIENFKKERNKLLQAKEREFNK